MSVAAILQHVRNLVAAQQGQPLSDRDLLHRFAGQRDQAAFAALVDRHGQMVRGMCRRLLAAEQDAEDAFQAVFLILARKAASPAWHESVGSWLHGVAYRVASDLRRRAATRQHHESRAPVASSADPADNLTLLEIRGILDEELRRLPERYRASLLLVYWEGRTQQEAAGQLGWRAGVLRGRLERGRERLRRRLQQRGITGAATLGTALLVNGPAPAHVPAPVIGATVQAALAFVDGTSSASAPAAALAETTLHAMALAQRKLMAGVYLTVAFLVVGSGVLAQQLAQRYSQSSAAVQQPPVQAQRPQPELARPQGSLPVDADGERLPPGALARMGAMPFQHGRHVSALAMSPDGKTLASAGFDKSIRLWQMPTGKEIRAFAAHEDYIPVLAFSPDGNTLASASFDKTIRLWDPGTGKEVCVIRGHEAEATAVAFAPDGAILASASKDKTIRLWQTATGKEIAALKGHEGDVWSLAFVPDGTILASASEDKTIRLWQTTTGKEVRTLQGHDKGVHAVAFAPDGKTLASTGDDHSIRLWETTTGAEICSLRGRRLRSSGTLTDGWALVFSADGKTLASGVDGALRLWDATTGKETRVISAEERAHAVAFTPDGKALASAGSSAGKIRLWDTATGKEIHTSQGHWDTVQSVTLAPDGRTLASAGADKTIRLWETATGRETRVFEGHKYAVTSVAFAADGKTLASASEDMSVRLWDMATGREIHSLLGHACPVTSVAFSPDGKVLASASADSTIRLWDTVSGKETRTIEPAGGSIKAVAFSPDGTTLASAGDHVRLWETTTGQQIRTDRVIDGISVAFSPDGKVLAALSSAGHLHLWEKATGQEMSVLHTEDFAVKSVRQVAFSPDGKILALAGAHVLLWETASRKKIRAIQGHRGDVTSVAFAPDGTRLTSGSTDTTVLVWALSGRRTAVSRLADEPLRELWAQLADADAGKAHDALWALVAAPGQALPFLAERLKPADPAVVAALIADLENEQFRVRQKASEDLEKLDAAAIPALRAKLQTMPGLEMSKRIAGLLEKLDGPVARLRMTRAIQVLEYGASPEARQLLKTLAQGAPGARLTQEATAALERLSKRPAVSP